MMNDYIPWAGKIEGIFSRQVELEASFETIADRFAAFDGTVILLSGGDLDCARYHILAARPWLQFRGYGQRIHITTREKSTHFEGDPFDTLRAISDAFRIEENDLPQPVAAGLFGYLGYDLKDHLEVLPRTTINDLDLPDICFFAPSQILIKDTRTGITHLAIPKRMDGKKPLWEADLADFERILKKPAPRKCTFGGDAAGFQSNFTRPVYENAVDKIKDYIAAGHVYQVNMSQRFGMDFHGDGYAFFRTLYERNPAPFYAYINAGDHQVISTSPERFLCLRDKKVETRPIKGTRPRGKNTTEDNQFRHELIRSKKDDAELSMIVDLLRNDLGKVCAAGSVKVVEHKRLEAYQNVYHLVSIVTGKLEEGRDVIDLIKAAFPGGSITGCPKIRAMEIIDELEPTCRHVYTGAIGYLGFHGTMDLNIAIRTAVIHNDKILFSVGGGIVFDSVPADEYEETLHKGRTLMTVFEKATDNKPLKNYAWVNGVIKPLEEVTVGVATPGFQYGYGFFETILSVKGHCPLLVDHLARFNRTWAHLTPGMPPDLSWDTIIDQVLSRNELSQTTAAVKIITARGDRKNPPWDHTLMVTVRPYTHRLDTLETSGIRLATYPEARQTPLANHKTLNYLYYLLAGRWAQTRGAHEALILNPSGTISETNTANIILVKNRTVYRPASPHVLPGVMEQAVCRQLKSWGYQITLSKLEPSDLFDQDEVVLTNALMGAVPVLSLDGRDLPSPSNLWQRINAAVLSAE